MSKDPKFQVFADTCAKKGYFNGVEVGSLEYLQRNAKLVKKFREKTAAASGAAAPAASKLSAEQAAEERKLEGNEAIQRKDYELAVQRYSEALQLSASGPNSHIYYANRAAAYCHLSDYKNAVTDCEAAVRKSPTYTKAYSRLGLAQFFLKNYAAAAAAYERAAELEPSNKAHQDSARQARQKLEEEEALAAAPAVRAPAGGMPDLASMMAQMGGAGGGGGLMGMAQQMMQNPAMMAQAQAMMQNPAMMAQAQQMMQNPAAMQQMMASMGMGGEAAPDPAQMAQMAQMFGGAGAAGAGSAGGVPEFSGFQNN